MEDKSNDVGEIEVYEVGYHILPSVNEESLSGEVNKIHSLITENEGNIVSDSFPIMRQLSYEISKRAENKYLNYNKAYFGWVKFEIERSKILDLKNKLDTFENILRFILVKTVKENTIYTPKAPSFKKEENEEVVERKDAESEPIDEAEIDKSIDDLVVQSDN